MLAGSVVEQCERPCGTFTVIPPGEDVDMARQLTLIDTGPAVWQLDARTKEIGRRGLASARAALAEHRPAEPRSSGDHHRDAA